jgi:hypothetical protein
VDVPRLLVLFVTATAIAAGSIAPDKYISWADDAKRYGWTDVRRGGRINESVPADPACRGTNGGGGTTAYLCSTENGGATWHRIFRSGVGLSFLAGYLRTSRSAGVVVRQGSATVWRSLPDPPTGATGFNLRLEVAWPTLRVVAKDAVWTSLDGGLTWTVEATG